MLSLGLFLMRLISLYFMCMGVFLAFIYVYHMCAGTSWGQECSGHVRTGASRHHEGNGLVSIVKGHDQRWAVDMFVQIHTEAK